MIRIALLGSALLAATLSPAVAVAQNPSAQAVPTSADQRLRSLYEDYARWDGKEQGYYEDSKGEIQTADYLPRVDAQSQLRRAEYMEGLLRQLNAIPAAQLSPEERINGAVLRTILENGIGDARFREWEMPFNSDSNFWTYLDASRPFEDAAAYRRYIGRMRDMPRYFDEHIANMRAGLARGFTVPKATLVGREASITNFTEVNAVTGSAFYKAFDKMPSTIPAGEQEALRAQAQEAITTSVLPAYRKLLAFYRDEYMPKARTTIAARDLPEGDGFYRAQVREFTTLELSPEEIHQIGLKEVARIDAEMRKTMRDSGFKGSFEDFLKFLRTDPQFYAKTPDELMGVSAYVAKRVDNVIGNYFEVLPRRRFGIIPVPEALAPFYTAGRGGLHDW